MTVRPSRPGIRAARGLPSWRVPERALSPGPWLAAAALTGILLVEVWQSSQMAELCLEMTQTRAATQQAQARLEFVRAGWERRTTRAELAPIARPLGLEPADVQQVVTLPSEYLTDDAVTRASRPASLLGWAERASSVLVPEATARGRSGR